MDLATILKGAANFLVGVSVVKLLSADLKTEIRLDGASLRAKASRLVQKSPYQAAGVAVAAGALMGIMLAHRRSHNRIIDTRS